MSDKEKEQEWHVERKRNDVGGGRMNINHKGLMPKCFNCNAAYKMLPSDKREFNFKAEHPKGSCPFSKDFYGEVDIEVVSDIRKYSEKMLEARNRNYETSQAGKHKEDT